MRPIKEYPRMKYLTAEQVAERLQVHPRTVKRWLQAGELNGYQLGDRAGWRVSEDDLTAFLDKRRGGEQESDDQGKRAA